MKYAHLADLHLGSWRDQKMRDLSTKSFLKAIDICVSENVDFILFAGDLFNTSLPALDTLKIVTKKLKKLSEQNIPVYIIAGSHDFSPSGKTMIDVLENAGLLVNVCKGSINPETQELHLNFIIDPKTQTKITGILGRKGQLDQGYYQSLHRLNLEQENGYKIFMFHTTIAELLPNDMAMIDSQPVSFLPQTFNYYAGGHIHHPNLISLPGYLAVTYPGALFPNNFQEFEKYGKGGFYIIDYDPNTNNQEEKWIPLEMIKHEGLNLSCNNKSPEVITYEILNHFSNKDLHETIITLRLKGTLSSGRVSDINFKQIIEQLYSQGTYFVMKNTAKLQSEEFEEIQLSTMDPEVIEDTIIKEHLQQIKIFDYDTELNLTKNLISSLNTTKKEGETITDFQKRIEDEIAKNLGI